MKIPKDLPYFYGKEERKRLVRLYGIPASWPSSGENPFGECRVLFFDDESGKPMAFWRLLPKPGDSGEDVDAGMDPRVASGSRILTLSELLEIK